MGFNMPDLLVGVRAKIARAEENIKNLNTEINAIIKADPPSYRVVVVREKDGLEYAFVVYGSRDIPPRIPVLCLLFTYPSPRD